MGRIEGEAAKCIRNFIYIGSVAGEKGPIYMKNHIQWAELRVTWQNVFEISYRMRLFGGDPGECIRKIIYIGSATGEKGPIYMKYHIQWAELRAKWLNVFEISYRMSRFGRDPGECIRKIIYIGSETGEKSPIYMKNHIYWAELRVTWRNVFEISYRMRLFGGNPGECIRKIIYIGSATADVKKRRMSEFRNRRSRITPASSGDNRISNPRG